MNLKSVKVTADKMKYRVIVSIRLQNAKMSNLLNSTFLNFTDFF